MTNFNGMSQFDTNEAIQNVSDIIMNNSNNDNTENLSNTYANEANTNDERSSSDDPNSRNSEDEIAMLQNIKKMKSYLLNKRNDCDLYLNQLDSLENFDKLQDKNNSLTCDEFKKQVNDFFNKNTI